jgi:predicted AlkP superfamily phosphohydrolase/phosphomutase
VHLNLLIIGLDGMTFDVINPLIDLGHLPNIAQLMREGSYSPLLSTVPSITPVAWSSFVTGKSPGDHGVYDWGVKTSDYRMSIINSSYLREQSIWTILHQADKEIGVIGLPMTYPPQPYPSFTVAGPLSPSVHSPFTFPESLRQEIEQNVGEYIIDFDKKQQLGEGEAAFVEAMARMVRARGDTTLYLMQNYTWDVLMPVFVATDRLQHCLWSHVSFMEPLNPLNQQIIGFYDLVDEYIGRLVEAAPDPRTVLIVSDHGFGPGKRKVSLNGWLMREGYLHWRQTDRASSMRRRLVALANHIGLTRRRLKALLSRLGLLAHLEDQLNQLSTYDMAFNWQRSIAFAGGPGIYLNVKGREREGIISPGAEYERLRDDVSERLSQLRDPKRDVRVFERVSRREDFYRGRRVDMAPDIVPVPLSGYKVTAQFYEEKSRSVREGVFADPSRWDQGMHRREGILIAWGEGIKAGSSLQRPPHIWDVAPTLLGLSGVPIPADMTGTVMMELIEPRHRSRISFTSGTAGETEAADGPLWASRSDEQLVEDRLRGLGYLE